MKDMRWISLSSKAFGGSDCCHVNTQNHQVWRKNSDFPKTYRLYWGRRAIVMTNMEPIKPAI